MASRNTTGSLGYGKGVLQCAFTVKALLLLLHLPVVQLCLFIFLLQVEEAVGARGRRHLHGETVPAAPPSHGAQLA